MSHVVDVHISEILPMTFMNSLAAPLSIGWHTGVLPPGKSAGRCHGPYMIGCDSLISDSHDIATGVWLWGMYQREGVPESSGLAEV